MADIQLRKIGWEYNEMKKSHTGQTLNVFQMVSDLYYRENFHSDIIKVFLDPSEKHKEDTAFLFAFIDFINKYFEDKVCISKEDYLAAKVVREYGNAHYGFIDLLIMAEERKHCIIVENKMYNAGDRYRQLPRYYDFMTENGYTVDAIVYLPLDVNKRPDTLTWVEKDKQNVNSLLCIVPAHQKKGVNLVSGWIEPCILKTKNIDCISILKQYGELLKSLSDNNMDSVILKKFYESLLKDHDNLETVKSISNMLQDLPVYMADRLCERFKTGEVDYKVWKWKPNFCGIKFIISGCEYKIDIYTSVDGYEIHVFKQNDDNNQSWAEGMESLKSFELISNNYYCNREKFSFYDEETLIECVKPIIEEMREKLIKKQ